MYPSFTYSDVRSRSLPIFNRFWFLVGMFGFWMSSGFLGQAADSAAVKSGYYRFPALFGNQLVFTAEGDLWTVDIAGGVAKRLTSHPGLEVGAQFSPDGQTIAFNAEYEGDREVYTMPATGGLPVRRTYDSGYAELAGWTPDGKLLICRGEYWGFPDQRIHSIDLKTGTSTPLPLAQASRGTFNSDQSIFFFCRLPFHRGNVKRYQGGTAENIWSFRQGDSEAKPLTADYPGTSRNPLWWEGRVYFLSDRDGTMNVWSMNETGGDLKQHTHHKGFDAKSLTLSRGRGVYQLGPDLHVCNLATGEDAVIPITLASDFDQWREKWVKKPFQFVSTVHLSPTGDRVVMTARGQVFVAPVQPGRLVEVTRMPSVRHRHARFFPDGKSVYALSDETGELEFVKLPANGVGAREPLTRNGTGLRYEGVISPDGKWLAWPDKDQKLWLYRFENQETKQIGESKASEFSNLRWSPDSRWLAYTVEADNRYSQLWLYRPEDGNRTALTSDRVSSRDAAWSPDGKWLYFLSDRHLESVVSSPWGPLQPEPYFDKPTQIFALALAPDTKFPFQVPDELTVGSSDAKSEPSTKESGDAKKADASKESKDAKDSPSTNKVVEVKVVLAGLQGRLWEVPVPPGNYDQLSVGEKRLFWISNDRGEDSKPQLQEIEITHESPKVKTLVEDLKSYELSQDGKKLLIWKEDSLYVEDASAGPPLKLEKSLELKDWTFSFDPRQEWKQIFVEAWRLERDYFYDRQMHGLAWPDVLKKYLPFVERVTERSELNDVIGDMVSELSALHIRTVGGDRRETPDKVHAASLGAVLVRDAADGGWKIDHVYQTDPEYPGHRSPLLQPGLDIREGEIIESINGRSTLEVEHPHALLRNQAGKQVLVRLKRPENGNSRDVVLRPITLEAESELRYTEWEHTRRLKVEEVGKGELGYVHLRAMGGRDIAQWAREFYPVYQRKGLIIDVRHNRGGNIDSWILEKLMRKAWFFWQPRVGEPTWNMQYAFRGHMVVLCDEFTGSDGEAFTEGFKRLGLGKVFGKRTWGGEIWLSASNWLVDHGIATAAEIGVFGPEGQWLIEGHGVDPDVVVDNLPHATFNGEDQQLTKAIEYLQEEIRQKPIPTPVAPKYPNKAAP